MRCHNSLAENSKVYLSFSFYHHVGQLVLGLVLSSSWDPSDTVLHLEHHWSPWHQEEAIKSLAGSCGIHMEVHP